MHKGKIMKRQYGNTLHLRCCRHRTAIERSTWNTLNRHSTDMNNIGYHASKKCQIDGQCHSQPPFALLPAAKVAQVKTDDFEDKLPAGSYHWTALGDTQPKIKKVKKTCHCHKIKRQWRTRGNKTKSTIVLLMILSPRKKNKHWSSLVLSPVKTEADDNAPPDMAEQLMTMHQQLWQCTTRHEGQLTTTSYDDAPLDMADEHDQATGDDFRWENSHTITGDHNAQSRLELWYHINKNARTRQTRNVENPSTLMGKTMIDPKSRGLLGVSFH